MKDLGPQISWRTVFFIEYVRTVLVCGLAWQSNSCPVQVGPLVIHPLFYHFPRVFFGGPVQHSTLQKYVPQFLWMMLRQRIVRRVGRVTKSIRSHTIPSLKRLTEWCLFVGQTPQVLRRFFFSPSPLHISCVLIPTVTQIRLRRGPAAFH